MNSTRDESFVPLAPAAAPANGRPDFRVTVLSHAENAQPFHLLGHPGAGASPAPAPNGEPKVEVHREGNQISSIRIQCACGRMIELACVYEPTPPTASVPASAPAAGAEPLPKIQSASEPESGPKRKTAPEPKPAKSRENTRAQRSRR